MTDCPLCKQQAIIFFNRDHYFLYCNDCYAFYDINERYSNGIGKRWYPKTHKKYKTFTEQQRLERETSNFIEATTEQTELNNKLKAEYKSDIIPDAEFHERFEIMKRLRKYE